ncbi:hypothetical protein DN069_12685 [Streptacidiphilus pinicola]|uniref:Uncharacterized protein n=1 Tax=Streptacidiphilus pinicola TaxID=2219663 RepID=A0A2X0KEC8_9ACTN|nr:DUF6229 family protein [Streptacidiphilus pinicola]RAG85220.1 hypothetical protein DN069_12685 [Streptacidiphilus pinicola]
MPSAAAAHPGRIVDAWLAGAETAFGKDNPAGPLFVGGGAAEAALTDSTDALMAFCSSPTGSYHSYCC